MAAADRRRRLAELIALEGPLTIESLVQRLGVSRRTLLRDVAQLRADGLELRSQSGPGGGLDLAPNALPSTPRLSESELLALWISSEVALASAVFPFVGPAKRGLRQLLAGLTPQRRRSLRAFARRIYVAQPASAQLLAAGHQPTPEFHSRILGSLERAFSNGRQLEIDYLDARRRTTTRSVEVHGMLVQSPLWYLLTHDTLRDAPRIFRVDRIRSARATAQPCQHRHDDVIKLLIEPYWQPDMIRLGGI